MRAVRKTLVRRPTALTGRSEVHRTARKGTNGVERERAIAGTSGSNPLSMSSFPTLGATLIQIQPSPTSTELPNSSSSVTGSSDTSESNADGTTGNSEVSGATTSTSIISIRKVESLGPSINIATKKDEVIATGSAEKRRTYTRKTPAPFVQSSAQPTSYSTPSDEDEEPSANPGVMSRKRKRVCRDVDAVAPPMKKQRISRPPGPLTYIRSSGMVADWDEYLTDLEGVRWVCPVDYFAHAPFSDRWQTFAQKRTKIELPHPQMIGEYPVYCMATIIAFAGYKALVQFQKVGKVPDTFAWISYCSTRPKPLTYSTKMGILILPVEGLEMTKPDIDFETLGKEFCEKLLRETYQTEPPSVSIAWDHGPVVRAELERHQRKFKLSQIVEAIDVQDISRNRLGIVVGITGDRVLVRYLPDADTKTATDEIEVEISMKSDLVHPLGWSHTIGFPLKNYSKSSRLPRLNKRHFPLCPSGITITKGMVMELIHPLRPYQIVSGYVCKVLRHGYFVACVNTKDDATKFVFHITSDHILPVGFCAYYRIPLLVPDGETPESFSWKEFCAKTDTEPLDLHSLPKKPQHRFVKECKMEAAAVLPLPPYFGPATVINVAEHLLLIHFDGWTRDKPEFSQWVSAFSTDIYPAGWAEMVGNNFQSHAIPHSRPDTYYISQKTINNTEVKTTIRRK